MSDEIWKSLTGAFGIGGAVLVWLLIQKRRNGKNGLAREAPETAAARNAAVERLRDKLDEAKKEIVEAITTARKEIIAEHAKTRHDLRGEMATFGGRIILDLKEHIDRIPRRRP